MSKKISLLQTVVQQRIYILFVRMQCLFFAICRFCIQKKFEKTGVVKELRRRQAFNKPSEVKRERKIHAIYVQQLQQNED